MLVADVVLLLAVGAVALLAGRALGLPAIVAYLVAGVLVGPGGAGLVPRSDAVSELAELGVALLLFGVGIEFSLDRLRRILPRMVASGALQMAGTIGDRLGERSRAAHLERCRPRQILDGLGEAGERARVDHPDGDDQCDAERDAGGGDRTAG